jgi:hypothetical protein
VAVIFNKLIIAKNTPDRDMILVSARIYNRNKKSIGFIWTCKINKKESSSMMNDGCLI